VYQADGYTKQTGETVFTVVVWLDGVVSAVTPVVTEIGTSGEYQVTFTPTSIGFWEVEVLIDYNKDTFAGQYDVVPVSGEALLNVAYDDGTLTMYLQVWLDRYGRSITQANLVSCEVLLHDQAGTLLYTLTSSSPGANGRFSLTQVMSLTDDRPYDATVTVTDDQGAVTTYHAFTTVE